MNTKDAVPTPRTDALLPTSHRELIEHAECLERELATSEAKLKEARKYMQHTETCFRAEWLREDTWPADKPMPACTCGLDAFLNPTGEDNG